MPEYIYYEKWGTNDHIRNGDDQSRSLTVPTQNYYRAYKKRTTHRKFITGGQVDLETTTQGCMGWLLMAGAQGLRDGVEGVHDDEEVDDERDEAGDQRPHHVAAVGPHLPADRQPPGVRVAVPPDVRYRAGGRHRADEKHPDDLHAFHPSIHSNSFMDNRRNRMRMTMQLHELEELTLEVIKVCAACLPRRSGAPVWRRCSPAARGGRAGCRRKPRRMPPRRICV
jgi:hypothetical protein